MKNKFLPPDYNTDIGDGIFDYQHYGNCVFKPTPSKWKNHSRQDIILFNQQTHQKELYDNINLDNCSSLHYTSDIMNLIQQNWDAFCKDGCRRPILGYEFAIDTGTATPVCEYNSSSLLYTVYHSFSECIIIHTSYFHQVILISFISFITSYSLSHYFIL